MMLGSDNEKPNYLQHIDDTSGKMIAYHGSSKKLNKIQAHTSGAYQDWGNVIFLTQYFGQACAFALNPNNVFEYFKEKNIPVNFTNIQNSMTFQKNIEKKKFIVSQIDIDLYLTANHDFDEDVIQHDIYIH